MVVVEARKCCHFVSVRCKLRVVFMLVLIGAASSAGAKQMSKARQLCSGRGYCCLFGWWAVGSKKHGWVGME
jgi:hypothetical protein